ncbi:MAG: VTT domain-containing protein [Acidobacteria bacterium]|nr:VTT domain-containing protein [Acidobacteriota bacterium]
MLKHLVDTLIEYGPLGLFIIGVLDSVGLPLPAAMDALLLAYSISHPEHAYFAAMVAVIGSAGGNILLFRAARMGGRRFVKKDTPESEQHGFRRWFSRYGLLTVFVPAVVPFVPLPLKVFVVSAGAMHTPTSRFLAVILAARVLRYFGEAYLGVLLGAHAQDFLRQNSWTIFGVLVGVAVLLGLIVKLRGRGDATVV